jgi:glutamate dehydrogenase/leucine dehydrogenase
MMADAAETVARLAESHGVSFREAAFISALERLEKAIQKQ